MAPRFHELEVGRIERLTPDAVAVTLIVPAELADAFSYRPGQYLTFETEIDGENVRRSYSIATPPPADGGPVEELTVGIKRVPGGRFSTFANEQLAVGDRLRVMPPEGRFTLGDERRVLLIAAGSGITPMMAIAPAVLGRGGRVDLVFGNRSTATIMFREALDALKDRHTDHFSLVHILSREAQDIPLLNGRIDGDKLARLARAGAIDIEGAEAVFLCGPGEMIGALEESLAKMGVPGEKIRTEYFTPTGEPVAPPSEAAEEAAREGVEIEVVVDGLRRSFVLSDPALSLVDAAHDQGVDLPFSCKGGMCCTCRCKVIEGDVELPVNYSLQKWELEAGFTLACQARPTSRKLVLDFDAA